MKYRKIIEAMSFVALALTLICCTAIMITFALLTIRAVISLRV